jgi:ribosomal protein L3 glutamine methyltransferase
LATNETIKDYIQAVAARFDSANLAFAHGTATALDDAVYLVYCLLEIDFSTALEELQQPLSDKDRAILEAAVQRRLNEQVPVAYLVQRAWFAGYEFKCDERALIPRSPIAELIANDFQPLLPGPPGTVLDMGTGSGCIGIACARQFLQARVILADISRDCLDLARDNISRHGLDGRVTAIESDLFAALDERYDLIVSNPPYVSQAEIDALPGEFRHEPILGLFSAEQGLAIPLAILREAADYLTEHGLLVMEVGYSAERLQQRLAGVPLLWLEFEDGGGGVFAITRAQLLQYREAIN